MRKYALRNDDRLVVSVDGADWEEVVFRSRDFDDVAQATAEEVTTVIQRLDSLDAHVDDEGWAVMSSASRGGHASLEVDLARSTAAPALGLAAGTWRAEGSGPQAARLVSVRPGPYSLPEGAHMSLRINGRRSSIAFDKGLTKGDADAADVAKAINSKARRRVARATKDGRLLLVSPTVGPGSRLEVKAGSEGRGKTDAAEPLGLVGRAALSDPHPVAPAEIALSGVGVELRASNLTATPIELHFPTGVAVIPAHGSLPLAGADAAHLPLQRLVEDGALALAAVPAAEDDDSNEDGA